MRYNDDAVHCKFCTTTILANINLTTCTTMTNTTTEIRTKSPSTTTVTSSEQHIQKASPSSATIVEEIEEQPTMNAEVEAAVTFLTDLIKANQFSTQNAEQFRKALTILLKQYYDGHWYPDEPLRGSGYRCLRVNGVMNPLLKKAAQLCSMPLKKFRQAFPVELTVWVDPGDVSVRFGEEGSIGVYYAKAGNCLKHDHQNFEELQRLATAAAAKRSSPQFGSNGTMMGNGNIINNNMGSSRSSPAPVFAFGSPFDVKSLKLAPQTPPRKILPFVGAGGRRTPTPSSSNGFFTQQNSPYGQQMAYHHGFGSPVEQQQQLHHHHQSPPQHHHQFEFATVRRPSPSPSPPEMASYGQNGGFSDWCKSEYQMYGNVHYGSSNNQHSYGRFARMMNACGRQEPVGAN